MAIALIRAKSKFSSNKGVTRLCFVARLGNVLLSQESPILNGLRNLSFLCHPLQSNVNRLEASSRVGGFHVADFCLDNCNPMLMKKVGRCRQEHTISRDWLAGRIMADKKRRSTQKLNQRRQPLQSEEGAKLSQPEVTEPLIGSLVPDTPEAKKIAPVLARPDLLITRNVEWANIAFGFEQRNRYIIMDPREPQTPVGYIIEESNLLLRQLLRKRRPFIAYVLDGLGNEIFKVRRPAWLITSKIEVEINGKVCGVVHERWHLWKRFYDLYLGNTQFGAVDNPGFWNWTFTVHDEDGQSLAEVDRNWRGFGFELFTDAGQYVVRFGRQSHVENERLPTGAQVDVLQISRPLTLLERATVLALAISLDNDYFSNRGAGWGIPIPFIGGAEE